MAKALTPGFSLFYLPKGPSLVTGAPACSSSDAGHGAVFVPLSLTCHGLVQLSTAAVKPVLVLVLVLLLTIPPPLCLSSQAPAQEMLH